MAIKIFALVLVVTGYVVLFFVNWQVGLGVFLVHWSINLGKERN